MTSDEGVFLRRGVHHCPLPGGDKGDVWRCCCGRRWTCRRGGYGYGGHEALWERRYWPWPRTPLVEDDDEEDTCRP